MMNKVICILIVLGILAGLIFDGILANIGIPGEYLAISLILLAAAAVMLDWATGKGGTR